MCGFIYSPFDPIPNHLARWIKSRGIQDKWSDDRKMYFRRLPIVNDLVEGDQPYVSANNKYRAMMVGEIFNWRDFMPTAPTDAVVLFEHFTRIHEFDGFWSWVMEDMVNKIVTIGTDFLAIKPVYFNTLHLIFCNEPRPLAILPDSGVEDEIFLSNCYKWGYDPTGRTPWKYVRQIKPGHMIWLDLETRAWKEIEYWSWDRVPNKPLKRAIKESVHHRLGGILEVGHLLSGGLDSTIIASHLPADTQCFYVDNEEAGYAEEAAHAYEHRLTRLEIKDHYLDQVNAVKAFQMPVDLGSLVPQYQLARAVNDQGYNVCLSGDGADELFSGYHRAMSYDSQASDTFVELPYWHLRRLDIIPMYFTIEQRCPFLAPAVVKAALHIPYPQRKGKKVLRDVFKDDVPRSILLREKRALRMPNRMNTETLIDTWRRN